MEIRQLDQDAYAGKKFTARYTTGGYYEISASETGFRMYHVPFEAETERSFDDEFFGEWLLHFLQQPFIFQRFPYSCASFRCFASSWVTAAQRWAAMDSKVG